MEQIVSFPGLGIGPLTLDRVAFTLFGNPVYWYGVLIALAFTAGVGYIIFRARTFGLDGDRALDVMLAAIVGAIIGARLYYVAFSWEQYKDNPLDIFAVWEGGLAVYGGIIAGFVVGYFFCRMRKIPFLPMADVAACGIILGQGIGRWGNFVNVEAFGSVTDAAWRMSSPSVASYLLNLQLIDQSTAAQIIEGTRGVHPTFFYESIWCILGFILLAFYTRHRRFDGELVLLYMFWYGLERTFVEGLRTDSLMVGGYRVSQLLSLALVIVAVVLLAVNYRRLRRASGETEQILYVYTETSRAQLAEDDRMKTQKKEKPVPVEAQQPTGQEEDMTQEEEPIDESNVN